MWHEKMKKCLWFLGFFIAGGLVVWGGMSWTVKNNSDSASNSNSSATQRCGDQYPFISGYVNCENTDNKLGQVDGLRSDVEKAIDEEKTAGHVTRAAVFFRDLVSKRWFGINDTDQFYPASLLKLPLAITFYKMAELQPDILDHSLTIPTGSIMDTNSSQHYPPAEPIVAGQSYPIKELIRRMLIYSDNAPFEPLAEAGGEITKKVFADFAMNEPTEDTKTATWSVSPRTYAGALRNLYNVSYLNSEYSNNILSILSQSTFTAGIVAGVPESVKVAHKFGEGTGVDEKGNTLYNALNDCGIVYRRNNPYILCVMTEGQDFSQLEKVIQRISEISYKAF